jgi:hypothetical protein
METQRKHHYTYYSYEEWGRGYFGVRSCDCIPEEDVKYFGTFKDKTFRPTQKIILKSDYSTREEANLDEIILHDYYNVGNNPHFANRAKATSTGFCYFPSKEWASKNGKKVGYNHKKNGTGIFSQTPEQRSELGRKTAKKIGRMNGLKTKENKTGIFGMTPEQKRENSRKIGNKNKENKTGVCGRSKEKMTEDGRKGGKIIAEINRKNGTGIFGMTPEEKSAAGKKAKELGLGIHGLTTEQRRENGKKSYSKGLIKLTKEERSKNAKKVNSQRWMCTETGFITNPGNLTQYQRRRGIDTSNRIRLE